MQESTEQTNTSHHDDGMPLLPRPGAKIGAAALSRRIDWVDSELEQLSTPAGVMERIEALRFIQSQLMAARAVLLAREK